MSEEKAPLWAPWRMEYVLSPKPGSCAFCRMATEPQETYRENLVLLVQPHALLCLNRYPYASGHLLVASRRHVSHLNALTDPEYGAMMTLLRDSIVRVEKALKPQGLNVGFNLGAPAGAGIAEHVHGHIVPRWQGDVNFMPVLADVRVMPEHLDTSWQRLYPFFADLAGMRGTGPSVVPPDEAASS
jgi:ATP adenylyltransferase